MTDSMSVYRYHYFGLVECFISACYRTNSTHMWKQLLPNKSNFVFVFEILGIIIGGFTGYVISMTLLSSSFDPDRVAGSLFVVLLFGIISWIPYATLLGAPVGYLVGYFLNQKKLGFEIGLISGMIILPLILLENPLLEYMFLVSYVCMIIGIIAGKIFGVKTGLFIEKSNK